MSSKSEVLKVFKLLHRTKDKVFQGDHETLNAVRLEINDYFRKNKAETDPEKIKELIKEAYLVEEDVRTKIIQVVEVAPGHHKARLTEDHCISEKDMQRMEKKIKKK